MQLAVYKNGARYPHLLLRDDQETDMIGYKILILVAAIVITGCEALVFVGATAGLN
jgi:hypothetical protein